MWIFSSNSTILVLKILFATVLICSSIDFEITPAYNSSLRDKLFKYRESVWSKKRSGCGLIWTLATMTGQESDIETLSKLDNSVGFYRIMSVAFEVMQSAGRARHAWQLNSTLPTICSNNIKLTLFVDRCLLHSSRTAILKSYAECIFDKIIYFDELPLSILPINTSGDNKEGTKRLSSRTNTLKLVALLSTPYQYTIYLDGDTAPCSQFPYAPFYDLITYDMFTTANPFGYQSTNNQKTYLGSPNHNSYSDFPEPNGGIIGYQWTSQTERLFIRSMELIPYFNNILGFDQDQAYLRHALYEEIHLYNLNILAQSMSKYCRFAWNCDYNRCRIGCILIHQRLCLSNGINHYYNITLHSRTTSSNEQYICLNILPKLSQQLILYNRKYHTARKKNIL